MISVGGPVGSVVPHDQDGVEKAAYLFDHLHEPLDVRFRCVALIRRRLDLVQWQGYQENRLSAERVEVGSENRASTGFDLFGELPDFLSGRSLGFPGRQALRSRRHLFPSGFLFQRHRESVGRQLFILWTIAFVTAASPCSTAAKRPARGERKTPVPWISGRM